MALRSRLPDRKIGLLLRTPRGTSLPETLCRVAALVVVGGSVPNVAAAQVSKAPAPPPRAAAATTQAPAAQVPAAQVFPAEPPAAGSSVPAWIQDFCPGIDLQKDMQEILKEALPDQPVNQQVPCESYALDKVLNKIGKKAQHPDANMPPSLLMRSAQQRAYGKEICYLEFIFSQQHCPQCQCELSSRYTQFALRSESVENELGLSSKEKEQDKEKERLRALQKKAKARARRYGIFCEDNPKPVISDETRNRTLLNLQPLLEPTKSARRLEGVGFALLGLGAVTLGTSIALTWKNGQLTDATEPCVTNGIIGPCAYDLTNAFALGYVVTAGLWLGGGLLIGIGDMRYRNLMREE